MRSAGTPPSNIKRRSQVELYSELMEHHAGPSKCLVESILKHPLSQIYLKLKWSQTQKFYYLFIVLPHLIYSIVYSMYSISVYRVLCPYPTENAKDSTIRCLSMDEQKDLFHTYNGNP